MTRLSLVVWLLLMLFLSPDAGAQTSEGWNPDAVQKTMDGMRRRALDFLHQIEIRLKARPEAEFPAGHRFLTVLQTAATEIDVEQPPSKWKTLDTERLMNRNPAYWAAVLEAEPADPEWMALPAAVHAVNGSIHLVLYYQRLSNSARPGNGKRDEQSAVFKSAERLIQAGNQRIKVGKEFHDQEKYFEAESVYREVLQRIPSHAMTQYELGYTLRTLARENRSGKKPEKPFFERAKTFDPFLIAAYQGDFSAAEFRQFQMLRSRARPAWGRFLLSEPTGADRISKQAGPLESLSSDLQSAGLHNLALLVRQLAVHHRGVDYSDADRRFLGASLESLISEQDAAKILGDL